MAVDLDLTYAQVAFKASHNSYERDEQPISTQLENLGADSWEGRCRGLELDINLSGRNWLWSVNHIGGYGGAVDQQLTAYLADLARWHRANPEHHVVTVTLDLKGSRALDQDARATSDLSLQLDAVLKEALPDAIYRPRDLQGGHGTLLEGAVAWPSLKTLAGKFVFFLSGSGDLKQAYLAGAMGEGCCFVDRKFNVGDTFAPETTPDVVFYNFDVDAWAQPQLAPRLKKVARQIAEDGRCIVRGYVVNNAQVWSRALDAGFSILSTDKVRAHEWATVGDEPFAPRLAPAPVVPRGIRRTVAGRRPGAAPAGTRAPGAARAGRAAGTAGRRQSAKGGHGGRPRKPSSRGRRRGSRGRRGGR